MARGGSTAKRAQAERLRAAFGVFTDAAARLETAYAMLRARVEQLSAELARANGELARELEHKQALIERQNALLAALPAGILVLDAQGRVREANAAAEDLCGPTSAGASWRDVLARLLPSDCGFERLTAGAAPRRIAIEERGIHGGAERIVLLHDVTEAHAARLRLERGQRLAAMGEMAARLAHQLRTPLATAMLYASQLECSALSSAQREGLGERILARLRSLERVTREMLRFVRGERAPDQVVAVSALLDEAAEVMGPLMAARGLAFACDDHSGAAVLRGDRRGLAAALLSLLENAAQSTDQGGKVRIDAMANSTRVRIRVSDSGSGIPAHALPRLFEPFYSTRSDGTGLGLAIVKSVIEAHGGSIDVRSDPAGTCFTLTLPCSTERPGAVAGLPVPGATDDSMLEGCAARLEREAA
ncbi:MAG: PAS domain-containing protein [Burkholderiales bacterium]|nr:PAS domain-containing protein [Burkholderiales bacterium]